jgi:hypothetical protein
MYCSGSAAMADQEIGKPSVQKSILSAWFFSFHHVMRIYRMNSQERAGEPFLIVVPGFRFRVPFDSLCLIS